MKKVKKSKTIRTDIRLDEVKSELDEERVEYCVALKRDALRQLIERREKLERLLAGCKDAIEKFDTRPAREFKAGEYIHFEDETFVIRTR